MLLRKLKELIIKRRKKESYKDNVLYMDIGASRWKAGLNGEYDLGKSSITEITAEEMGTRGNTIQVNNKYYSVGDRDVNCSIEVIKHKKKDIEKIILYALATLHNKIQNKKKDLEKNGDTYTIDLYLLLPYNQLNYILEWRWLLEGKKWKVRPNLQEEKNYIINVREVLPEGAMTRYYVPDYKLKGTEDVIISDWGHSTIDNVGYWTTRQEQGKGVPINRGIRDLLVRHNFYIKRKSADLLGVLYGSGKYKIPKTLLSNIEKENISFINNVMEEMELSLLGDTNEYNTSVVFTGGGAVMLKKSLIDYFANNQRYKNFNLVFLEEKESIFSNILGMEKYVQGKRKKGKEMESNGKEMESNGKEMESNGKEINGKGKEKEINGKGKERGKKEKEINGKGKESNGKEREIIRAGKKGENLNKREKKEIVKKLIEEGKSVKEIAILFQVSPKTVRNWRSYNV